MDSDQPRVRDMVNDEPCQVLPQPHEIAVFGAGQVGSTPAYAMLTSGLGAANQGMKREEEQ